MTTLFERTVASHLQDMLPHARVLPLEALRGTLAVGCVDGRRHDCVIGAPGGNAGLLVVLLAALEQVRGIRLSGIEQARLFEAYLDHFGDFYFHSDSPAVAALHGSFGAAERGDGLGTPQAPNALVLDPPPGLRARLLEALVEPVHVGCGHLRNLLEAPEGSVLPDGSGPTVRPDLVRGVLREAYRGLWRGDPRIHFEILSGNHQEEGVLRIHTSSSDLVAACPHHGLHEFFVLHPDAVAWLETLHADFAAEAGWIPAHAVPRLVDAQRILAERVLAATLAALAGGLPVFDVKVASGSASGADVPPRGVTVRAAGFVPRRGDPEALDVGGHEEPLAADPVPAR